MVHRIFSFVLVTFFLFSTSLYASGAGVLLFFKDGTVLMGKELRAQGYVWSDFGGKQDRKESLPQTAFREFTEETGHFSFPQITFKDIIKSPYIEHHHRVGSYRMYIVHAHGKKPSIHEITQNAKKAKKKFGHKAHVEKVEWKYVTAQALLQAVAHNSKFPGTNEEIFGPLKACLKKPKAQGILKNINASAKHPAPQPTAIKNKPKFKNNAYKTKKKRHKKKHQQRKNHQVGDHPRKKRHDVFKYITLQGQPMGLYYLFQDF